MISTYSEFQRIAGSVHWKKILEFKLFFSLIFLQTSQAPSIIFSVPAMF